MIFSVSIFAGQANIVNLLIDYGADVNHNYFNGKNRTPLDTAAKYSELTRLDLMD